MRSPIDYVVVLFGISLLIVDISLGGIFLFSDEWSIVHATIAACSIGSFPIAMVAIFLSRRYMVDFSFDPYSGARSAINGSQFFQAVDILCMLALLLVRVYEDKQESEKKKAVRQSSEFTDDEATQRMVAGVLMANPDRKQMLKVVGVLMKIASLNSTAEDSKIE